MIYKADYTCSYR